MCISLNKMHQCEYYEEDRFYLKMGTFSKVVSCWYNSTNYTQPKVAQVHKLNIQVKMQVLG